MTLISGHMRIIARMWAIGVLISFIVRWSRGQAVFIVFYEYRFVTTVSNSHSCLFSGSEP